MAYMHTHKSGPWGRTLLRAERTLSCRLPEAYTGILVRDRKLENNEVRAPEIIPAPANGRRRQESLF